MRSTVNEQDSKIAAEEQMYAEVLGLRHPIAPSDVKSAYQHLLAKYHPDKVSQLGEEFSRIAQKKTQEIMQAYQYFQRKYGIT